jgi:DNA-binding CsgD family transcriptional regulator
MGVSPQTIFFHRSNIRKKLGLTGTANELGTYLRQKAWG